MMNKRIATIILLTGLCTLIWVPLAGEIAYAKNFRMVIGSGHPAEAGIWVARTRDFFAKEVKARVEAKTEHKIEWIDAYGGTVAQLGNVLEAVQAGTLDAAYVAYPFEPTKLFLYNVGYYTPFSSPDILLVARVWEKLHERFPFLKEYIEKQYNQKVLGFGPTNCYHLITSFPVKKIEDLKGRKVTGAGPNLILIKSVGGTPVQSVLNESYTSIQTGVYQGVVIFIDPVIGFKLYEVAKYYTFTDFGAIASGMISINLDRWNTLPKEIQDIMVQVGKEFSLDLANASLNKYQQAVEILKKNGVNLYQLPFEEKMRWANALPDIPAEKAKEADQKGLPGTQIFNAYMEEMEKEGFKFPRRWMR